MVSAAKYICMAGKLGPLCGRTLLLQLRHHHHTPHIMTVREIPGHEGFMACVRGLIWRKATGEVVKTKVIVMYPRGIEPLRYSYVRLKRAEVSVHRLIAKAF